MSVLYRVIEEETRREIFSACELDGFFKDESRQPESSHVWFLDTSYPLEGARGWLEDVELQVLDFRREIIGSYYIGDVEVVDIQPSDFIGETDLMLDFRGYFEPFPYAGKIWRRWASGVPVERDEWRSLPAEWHDSWLHVVQTAWFEAGRMPTVYEPKDSYTINGNGMVNTDSFYCALGEAINGPGGYFGSNLDALDDCLMNAVGYHGPFELVWRNFHVAETNLGESEIVEVVAVFRDRGVRVIVQRS